MGEVRMANGSRTLQTPNFHSLSMTEYVSHATPPSEKARKISEVLSQIPSEYLLPNGYPDYLRLILTSRVYDVIEETKMSHAVNLSNRLESRVLLKREDLLPVFSFKLRGAYNKMAHLPLKARWKGVIACSAGNHAQGVAYSARRLKIPATIVMPSGTPAIKHNNVSRLGGAVVLHGADFDAAKQECHRLAKIHGLTDIPPFDDPYVIAGQGTIGLEILRQASLQNLEAIFCCVGGGGLIAGIGIYVKRIAPHVKIIGVEANDASAMAQSLIKGERVSLLEVGLFADGAAVKTVGEETFRVCMEVVDEIILVSTDETCAAIKDVFEDTRSIVEPAGALALAGLKKYVAANPSPDPKRELVAIASGANMNFDRLRFVADRAALGEKKEALLSVAIPEHPGSFAQLVELVAPQSVTEFSYRYSQSSQQLAHIMMGISVTTASSRGAEISSLSARLDSAGMTMTDISDDELAKTHIRYLVGGRSNVDDERLYMFEFPERPGALLKFLMTMKPGQNISLFHYRNYGGDIGRVLAGIQCPEAERGSLNDFLNELGYPFRECSDSPTYKTFLRESTDL
jgi:threonine dehydratase